MINICFGNPQSQFSAYAQGKGNKTLLPERKQTNLSGYVEWGSFLKGPEASGSDQRSNALQTDNFENSNLRRSAAMGSLLTKQDAVSMHRKYLSAI